MGLCKCPKKVVTTLFCYEHRVNVCQKCMVTNHPKCIVQSYLQWLQDTDYDSHCKLCTSPLDTDECLRLVCLHLFHWKCLNEYYSHLPPTTAPAGYNCLACNSCVFPSPNTTSPVADVLREKLSSVNWGRRGLGLPLLTDNGFVPHSRMTRFVDFPTPQTSAPATPNKWLEDKDIPARRDSTVLFVDHAQDPDSQLLRNVHNLADAPSSLDADDNKYARRMPQPSLSFFMTMLLNRRLFRTRSKLMNLTLFLLLLTFIYLVAVLIDSSLMPE